MFFETFYDRSLRLWTALRIDERGNQDGSAGYGMTREAAIADLEPPDGAREQRRPLS